MAKLSIQNGLELQPSLISYLKLATIELILFNRRVALVVVYILVSVSFSIQYFLVAAKGSLNLVGLVSAGFPFHLLCQ